MSDEAVENMRSGFFSLPRLLVVLIVLILFAYLWASASPYRRYWVRQRELASSLGVEIGDYPLADAFPVGYFRAKLRQGMPASEVHKIVTGYESVYRCDGRSTEVYYYFSREDARALRFEISYDSALKFDSLGTEDARQRTIHIEGCIPGLVGQ